MSSPSPDLQKSIEHTYQQSDSTDHSLITCSCSEKQALETPKTETNHTHCLSPNHHHNVINLTHVPPPTTNHIHPISQVHVHVHASPKSGHVPKVMPTCTCHLQESNDGNEQEMHESGQHRKIEADDRIEVSPLPPALPPRPPPRPRYDGTINTRSRTRTASTGSGRIRKYVFWCCACGGLSTILGALFLAVYFLLRSYTSTLGYFETIPTFVPAMMLILTGLCVMSLARRKNRYSYLLKVCGLCCLVCALTCVLVTITTTVIHMNRLQTLRECVYTQKSRTCTCYSVLLEAHSTTDEGVRFVFDSTPDCEVIHGALYSCLRAMFGLSVSGILVCIFSCMLVYQLLSHERKKMYWEQLELRCRSFYQQHGGAQSSAPSSMRGPPLPPATYCSCCEECMYPPMPAAPQMYPWDTHTADRFWTPGRVGNFYSPNPGEDLINSSESRDRTATGWNWRRLPWSRPSTQQNMPINENHREHSLTYQGVVSSADSQYGFSNRSGGESTIPVSSNGSYSVLDNRQVGGVYVWGPPPPYSNPNSPARRPVHSPARYHHIHHQHHLHPHDTHCQMNEDNQFRNIEVQRRPRPKDNYENTGEAEVQQSVENSENTDTSSCTDRVSHTLPARKMKKRVDISSVKSVAPVAACRTNVKNVFNQNSIEDDKNIEEEHKYHEPNLKVKDTQSCRFLPRLQGVENAAFQKQENSPQKAEPTESEVYFADVSSCCNISVRNDGHESSLYDEALEAQQPRLISLQCIHKQSPDSEIQNFQENLSLSTVEDEDYLAQKLGNRQMSTRSRLPFPLPTVEDLTITEETCGLPKDLSMNSICSSVQTPMTDTTDDAVSPISPNFPNTECCLTYIPEKNTNHEQIQRRTFSNTSLNEFLAPDAQYEVIQENATQPNFRHNYEVTNCNLTNTISGLNNYTQNYLPNFNKNSYNQNNFIPSSPKNIPPKTLNLNQSPNRRNIGSNISTLIQNLGANSAGLLYSEANSGEEEEMQGQSSHSDGTIDSGWQSGSEKIDRNIETLENTTKSVNV